MDYCKYNDCKYYSEDVGDKGYRVYDEKMGICKLNNNSYDTDYLHTCKCQNYEGKLINKIIEYIK